MKIWTQLAALAAMLISTNAMPQTLPSTERACAACIRAHMEFLASDMLRGRGCGTDDEHVAARYLASELRQYGIAPAASPDNYLQPVELTTTKLAGPPTLEFDVGGKKTIWTHGKEVLVVNPAKETVSGPLLKISAAQERTVPAGSVVYFQPADVEDQSAVMEKIRAVFQAKVAAVLMPPRQSTLKAWKDLGETPTFSAEVPGAQKVHPDRYGLILRLAPEAMKVLDALPDGTPITIRSEVKESVRQTTYNVIGLLQGTGATDSILLTAHYDHLGVGKPVNGDSIYNGANDDASGTTAVLELARALSAGSKPKRSIYFALFGCEEEGELGASYFRVHSPVPLTGIAANLEFEMIGAPDPKSPKDTLLLTGWDRSNLGPVLKEHGAKLGPDSYPEENLFEHSDNFALAQLGVVAQTAAGSGPLISTLHQPDDDLQHVDLNFIETVIGSFIEPIQWLANSNFRPQWNPGKNPQVIPQ